MKRPWPYLLIAVGFALSIAGLVYDILFAGIPYQDPSPRLQAAYLEQALIATQLIRIGGFVTFLGIVAVVVRSAIRFVRRQFGTAPTEFRSN